MAYFCYFSFGENLDFPDFLQKKFYNINYRFAMYLSKWAHYLGCAQMVKCTNPTNWTIISEHAFFLYKSIKILIR